MAQSPRNPVAKLSPSIVAPGVALFIVGLLNLAAGAIGLLLGLVVTVMAVGAGGPASSFSSPFGSFPAFPGSPVYGFAMSIVFLWMLVSMIGTGVVCLGGWRVWHGQGRGWGLAAATILIIQGLLGMSAALQARLITGGWSLIELGVGIWALVVLLRGGTQAEFERAGSVQSQIAASAPEMPQRAALESARRRVRVPAVGLMVASVLGLLVLATLLGILLFGVTWTAPTTGRSVLHLDLPGYSFQRTQSPAGPRPLWIILGVPLVLAWLALSLTTFIGAWRMRTLRNYRLAMTGALFAMVTPPGFVLGLPFGLWAVIRLLSRPVREAFRMRAHGGGMPENTAGSPAAPGGFPRTIIAMTCLLLLLMGAAGIGVMVSRMHDPAAGRQRLDVVQQHPSLPGATNQWSLSSPKNGELFLDLESGREFSRAGRAVGPGDANLISGKGIDLSVRFTPDQPEITFWGCSLHALGSAGFNVVDRPDEVQPGWGKSLRAIYSEMPAPVLGGRTSTKGGLPRTFLVRTATGPVVVQFNRYGSTGDGSVQLDMQSVLIPPPLPPPANSSDSVAKQLAVGQQLPPGEAVNPVRPTNASAMQLPLIQITDTSLPDVIRNLARQAGLNYVIEPELAAELERAPAVTVRWENIAAGQALIALLESRNLQWIENPQSGVARVVKRQIDFTSQQPTEPQPGVSLAGATRPVISTHKVTIAADGTITVAGEPCPANRLAAVLSGLAAHQAVAIEIHADKSAPFRQLVAVMDACKAAGINQVTSVSATGRSGLEFRWVASDAEGQLPAEQLPDGSDPEGERTLRVLPAVVMDTSDVETAELTKSNGPIKEVSVKLNTVGGRKLAEATAGSVGRQLAIVWNGRVVSAPRIMAPLSGDRFLITGRFTDAEVQQVLDGLNRRRPVAAHDTGSGLGMPGPNEFTGRAIQLTGTVTEAFSGTPIANARVGRSFPDRADRPESGVWTDAEGRFDLATWDEPQELRFEADGYQTVTASFARYSSPPRWHGPMAMKLRPRPAPVRAETLNSLAPAKALAQLREFGPPFELARQGFEKQQTSAVEQLRLAGQHLRGFNDLVAGTDLELPLSVLHAIEDAIADAGTHWDRAAKTLNRLNESEQFLARIDDTVMRLLTMMSADPAASRELLERRIARALEGSRPVVFGKYTVHSVTLSDDRQKALVQFVSPSRTLWEGTLKRDEFGRWTGSVPAPGVNAIFEINILVPEDRQIDKPRDLAAVTTDLKARLSAAASIPAFTTRDETLAGIAADAARAGVGEVTQTAVSRITAFSARDEAIAACAPLLGAAGSRAAALELAQRVTALTARDGVLAALAADSARAGDLESTRTAVSRITAFTKRDESIRACARLLVAANRRAEALELVKLVTAATTRGELIQELAK